MLSRYLKASLPLVDCFYLKRNFLLLVTGVKPHRLARQGIKHVLSGAMARVKLQRITCAARGNIFRHIYGAAHAEGRYLNFTGALQRP